MIEIINNFFRRYYLLKGLRIRSYELMGNTTFWGNYCDFEIQIELTLLFK